MSNKYSILILWSDENQCFIAQTRELPGCMADGRTQLEALQALFKVQTAWLETAIKEGREIRKACTEDKELRNAREDYFGSIK